MFCTHCGKEIHDKTIICPYCGVGTDLYRKDMSKKKEKKLTWSRYVAIFPIALGAILLLGSLVTKDGFGFGIFFIVCGLVLIYASTLPVKSSVRQPRTVYYTIDGKRFHYSRSCIHAENVLSCSEHLVGNIGLKPCSKCCRKR